MWRGTRDQFLVERGLRTVAVTATVGVIAQALIVLFLWRGGYPTWRITLPPLLFVAMVSIQFATFRWARRQRDPERGFILLHAVSQLYLVGVCTITGGLYSPIMPVLGISTALPIVFFGASSTSRWLTASSVAWFVAMAAIPPRYLGPHLPHEQYATVAVVAFVWAAIIVGTFLRQVTLASTSASAAVEALSEERVAVASEQMTRLQSVGAKVAHELKNPLASVKGLVQLMARASHDDRSRERLEVVQSEVARMEAILREYLSFSRPLEDLRPQPVDAAAVVADAVAVIAGRAEHGGLTVAVDSVATPIIADPRRLKEALLNLLANAVEATPAGGTITARTRPGNGGGAVIEVTDTGRGIRPEDLDRLGTSFFTTRDGGTGLGVVLATSVVAQHGGAIHYASRPGRGTTVTVKLPSTPTPGAEAPLTTDRAA